jgi:hypothetical protein
MILSLKIAVPVVSTFFAVLFEPFVHVEIWIVWKSKSSHGSKKESNFHFVVGISQRVIFRIENLAFIFNAPINVSFKNALGFALELPAPAIKMIRHFFQQKINNQVNTLTLLIQLTQQ